MTAGEGTRICQAPDCGKSIAHMAPQARYCDNSCTQRATRQRKSDRRGHRHSSLSGQEGYFDALDATRGYLRNWRPRQETVILVGRVRQILDEYRDNLPLTVRQIYYRMIAEWKYPKGKKFQRQLYAAVGNARRAGRIPFDAIRDDGIQEYAPWYPSGAGAVIEDFDIRAECFERNMQDGQPQRLQVWCESAGMVPQLARVTRPYAIPVYSCGGFVSLTAVRAVVDSCDLMNGPTVVLHLGDCDPSAYSIYQSMFEDVDAFVQEDYRARPEITFKAHRVAATFNQIKEYGLVADAIDTEDTRARVWRARGHTQGRTGGVLAAADREAVDGRHRGLLGPRRRADRQGGPGDRPDPPVRRRRRRPRGVRQRTRVARSGKYDRREHRHSSGRPGTHSRLGGQRP